MTARLFLGVFFCMCVCAIAPHGSTLPRDTRTPRGVNEGTPSIAFEPMTPFAGGPGGDFFARAGGYDISLAADRVTFQMRSAAGRTLPAPMVMTLVSADPRASLTAAESLPGKVNYLIGNDRSQWQRNLPTWASVIERGAWHGIDVVYYGSQDHVETDFVVAAGADPGQIALDFDAAGDVALGDHGELTVSASTGQTLHFMQPVAYQRLADGRRANVASHYVIAASQAGARRHRVTLDVAPYDTGRPLVIDPEVLVLDYSTYIGRRTDSLVGNAVAVDDSGHAFMAGADTSNGRAFIKKYSANGRTLLFTTFLGRGLDMYGVSSTTTVAEAIALAPGGEHAYVTGYTQDSRFPTTPGAFESGDRIWLTGSAFVVKLTEDGSDFVYATLLIGDGLDLMGFYTTDTMPPDVGRGIAVDRQGHAYVVGTTSHSGWPTSAHALFSGGQPDKDMAFLTEFSSDGTRVLYSTLIGASGGGSYATGVAVDQDDSIYLTGRTVSPSFPTRRAFQSHLPRHSIGGFVMKFVRVPVSVTFDGFEPHVHFAPILAYSTYLGGGPGFVETDLNGIAVDGQGAMYVAGYTTSVEYPCTHAFQCPFQHNEHSFAVPAAIVTKIRPDGQSLAYSTFLQGVLGGGITEASAIAVRQGNAYVTGLTDVADFPVRRAFQEELCCGGHTGDSVDAFVTKLSDDGASLVWSTFLGGGGDDEGLAIAVDHEGSAYVTGSTNSAAFPLRKPELDHLVQDFNGFVTNGFLTKLHLEAAPGGQH